MDYSKPFKTNYVKKKEVKCYHLRFDYEETGGGGGWAIFYVDDNHGICSAVTDWGDYAHRWPLDGMRTKENGEDETLTEFLTRIDYGYAFTKFIGDRKKFDLDATKLQIKRDILYLRREGNLDSEEARQCWDEISDYNEDGISTDAFMFTFGDNCIRIYDLIYDSNICEVPRIHDYSIHEQIFIRKIFPAFQQFLKEELNETQQKRT
jgi:hypothetical protein